MQFIKQTIRAFILIFIFSLSAGNVLAASRLTGTVNVVQVNEPWGGIMIQLSSAPTFETGSACASTWAFIPMADPFANLFLSIATTAKVSGLPVVIQTNGCTNTSVASIPLINAIEIGMRIGF